MKARRLSLTRQYEDARAHCDKPLLLVEGGNRTRRGRSSSRRVRVGVDVSIARARTNVEFQAFRDLLVAYEESLPPALRHGIEPDAESVGRAYSGQAAAFIAAVDGTPAGCVALEHLDRSTILLKRMYVAEQQRQRGLARSLLEAAVAFAREKHYARVVLDTDPAVLSHAFRFYVSAGFTACEPYGVVDYPNAAFLELRL